jgi:uncharacterized protein
MLRHCVVIITRYCAMIALVLVVGFATGVFIEVVKLKATGADVSFIWRPVTPRYQVVDRAGQAVAQITQPPTPAPEITEPPTPAPSITSIKPVPPASVSERAASSLLALQNAAEGGHLAAQWQLGRMYAHGNGVVQDDLRAFEYFKRIADTHAEDSPSAPQAAIVANAFIALGRYYLAGITNSKITSDPERAREMFSYAASYFGNADAQYEVARLYLKNASTSRDDAHNGMRWLELAAQKGQHQAQAMLDQMLCDGVRSLVMRLMLACEPDHGLKLLRDKPDIPKYMDDIPQRWSDLPAGLSDSSRD